MGGGVTHDDYSTVIPTGYVRAIWGDFTAALHAETYYRTTPYMNGFNQLFSDFDDPNTYELDRWLWGDVKYTHHVGDRLVFSARLYGDSYDFQQRLHSSDVTLCPLAVTGACNEYVVGVSRWGGLELQANEDWLGDDRLTTLVGVDPRVRWIGAKTDSIDGAGVDVGSVGAKTALDFPVGVYAQQRWTPIAPLHFNGGLRFDEDPRGGDHLSPRAAATWNPWRGGALKALYSEAFRSPTFYEYYYVATGQIANPNLKAETVRSVEASLEQRFGGHRVLFGAFRSWWSDMVQLREVDPATDTLQYQNTSSLDNYGFNAVADGAEGPFATGSRSPARTRGGIRPRGRSSSPSPRRSSATRASPTITPATGPPRRSRRASSGRASPIGRSTAVSPRCRSPQRTSTSARRSAAIFPARQGSRTGCPATTTRRPGARTWPGRTRATRASRTRSRRSSPPSIE